MHSKVNLKILFFYYFFKSFKTLQPMELGPRLTHQRIAQGGRLSTVKTVCLYESWFERKSIKNSQNRSENEIKYFCTLK